MKHKKTNSNERSMRAATVSMGYANLQYLLDRQTHRSQGGHIQMHGFVHLEWIMTSKYLSNKSDCCDNYT